MRLELLADLVALALQRFTVPAVKSGKIEDLRFEIGDDRIGRIEIARLAGAKGRVAVRIRDGRGTTLFLDPLDEHPAHGGG